MKIIIALLLLSGCASVGTILQSMHTDQYQSTSCNTSYYGNMSHTECN